MTWSRAALHWLVAAVLATAFLATRRPGEPVGTRPAMPATPSPARVEPDEGVATSGASPAPVAGSTARAPSVVANANGRAADDDGLPIGPTWIRIERGDAAVAWRRSSDGSWKVETPPGKAIPPGLLAAFADQLDAVRAGERVEAPGPDSDFGLDHPSLRIEWSGSDGRRGEIRVGDRTPTGTASYGRAGKGGGVRIVGASLVYYADLVLAAAR